MILAISGLNSLTFLSYQGEGVVIVLLKCSRRRKNWVARFTAKTHSNLKLAFRKGTSNCQFFLKRATAILTPNELTLTRTGGLKLVLLVIVA
jgi:hypothetical protein